MTATRHLLDGKAAAPVSEDLAELVDEAVKALSIGNPVGGDGELRRAVDSLKRLEAERAERQAGPALVRRANRLSGT